MTAGESDILDAELLRHFPDVRLDHDNKHYYRSLLRRELRLNRCGACHRWHGPPLRPMCPDCWSFDIVPEVVSGAGRIVLLTKLHAGPPADGVTYDPPYPLIAVELVEQAGLRVSGTYHSARGVEPTLGLDVMLSYLTTCGRPFVAFEPVSPS